MRKFTTILLICIFAAAAMTLQAAKKNKAKPEAALREAWNQRGKQQEESLQTAADAVAGKLGEIPKDVKISAYDLQVEIYCKKRDWAKAILALDEQQKAFPQDKAIDRKVIFRKSDIYRQKNKDFDLIVQQLHDFVDRNKNEPELCAEVLLRSADFLNSLKKYPEYYADSQKGFTLAKGNLQLQLQALWKMQDGAGRINDLEKRCQALQTSLQPEYRAIMRYNDIAYRIAVYTDAMIKLNHYKEIEAFLRKEEDIAETQEHRQEWCFRIANSLYDQKKYPEALDAYERVFTDHPDTTRYWRNAQDRRVDILTKLGKPELALQEMRIIFDDAQNEGDIRWACERIAGLFREIDKNSDRADTFIAFQVFGPAGPDEKIGTEDDLVNPLLKVPYPQYQKRRLAMAKAIAESGDSYDDATYRGTAYIYTGQPKEALLQFLDAFRRYSDKQYHIPVLNVILRGLRAVNADSHSVPAATEYLIYGPDGKDGKKGTADDPKNPFSGLGLPSSKTLPACSKAEKEDLKLLWNELANLAGNPKEERNRRRLSIQALRRIYETAAIDPEELYNNTLSILQNGAADPHCAGELLCLGLAASRKYRLTLPSFEAFKKDLDASLSKTDESFDNRSLDELSKTLDKSISMIKKSISPPKLRAPKNTPKSTPKTGKKKK